MKYVAFKDTYNEQYYDTKTMILSYKGIDIIIQYDKKFRPNLKSVDNKQKNIWKKLNLKPTTMETLTKTIISELVKELKKDKGYREGWKANIAMAYIDNEHWYKEKTGKKYLNRKDKYTIANKAAEHFLKLLCDEYKYSNGNTN